MIILAFTDPHGDLKAIEKAGAKAKKADLIVCAGDITIFERNIRRIMDRIASFGKPTIIIPGNHESEEVLKRECARHKNIIYLHGGVHELGEYAFIGFGGGGFSIRDRAFEGFSKKIKKLTAGKKLVLITHGPPHGNRTDNLGGEYVGNKSYTDFIRKEKPLLAICGHIHETNGKQDKIGKTVVINPGPEGKLLRI